MPFPVAGTVLLYKCDHILTVFLVVLRVCRWCGVSRFGNKCRLTTIEPWSVVRVVVGFGEEQGLRGCFPRGCFLAGGCSSSMTRSPVVSSSLLATLTGELWTGGSVEVLAVWVFSWVCLCSSCVCWNCCWCCGKKFGGNEIVGQLFCRRRVFITSICFLRMPQAISIEYFIIKSVRNCLSVVVEVF